MPTNFSPIYSITPGIAKSLMRIEVAKEKVALLPVNPTVLASLHETAKLYGFVARSNLLSKVIYFMLFIYGGLLKLQL